jgi:hypothetical protein
MSPDSANRSRSACPLVIRTHAHHDAPFAEGPRAPRRFVVLSTTERD